MVLYYNTGDTILLILFSTSFVNVIGTKIWVRLPELAGVVVWLLRCDSQLVNLLFL